VVRKSDSGQQVIRRPLEKVVSLLIYIKLIADKGAAVIPSSTTS